MTVTQMRRKKSSWWFVALIVAGCVATSTLAGLVAESLEAQTTDSAGVKIIEVGPVADRSEIAGQCKLSDEPSLQIGSVAGEETALFEVESGLQLSAGRIAIANRSSGEVRVFGASGEHLYSVGRLGDGPGDFRHLAAMGLHEDRIVAYDMVPSRITVIDSVGEIVGDAQVEFNSRRYDRRAGAPIGGITAARGMPAVGWLESGVLVLKETERIRVDRPVVYGESVLRDQDMAALILVDVNGSLVARVDSLLGDESTTLRSVAPPKEGQFSFGSTALSVPFSKTFQAAVGRNVVAAGHTGANEISFYDAAGDLTRILRRLDAPRRVDRRNKAAWIRAVVEAFNPPSPGALEKQLEAVDFPEFMPAFKSLALDARDRLWVEEFLGSNVDGSRWTVYDEDGEQAGIVAMPAGFRPMSFGPDHVLGVWKDELEVEYVQKYDLSEGCRGP